MEGFSVLPHVCMIPRRSKGNPYTAGVAEEKKGWNHTNPRVYTPQALSFSNAPTNRCSPAGQNRSSKSSRRFVGSDRLVSRGSGESAI